MESEKQKPLRANGTNKKTTAKLNETKQNLYAISIDVGGLIRSTVCIY